MFCEYRFQRKSLLPEKNTENVFKFWQKESCSRFQQTEERWVLFCNLSKLYTQQTENVIVRGAHLVIAINERRKIM